MAALTPESLKIVQQQYLEEVRSIAAMERKDSWLASSKKDDIFFTGKWDDLKTGGPSTISDSLTQAARIRLGLEESNTTITRSPLSDPMDVGHTSAVYVIQEPNQPKQYFLETSTADNTAYPTLLVQDESKVIRRLNEAITDAKVRDVYFRQKGVDGYIPQQEQFKAIKAAYKNNEAPQTLNVAFTYDSGLPESGEIGVILGSAHPSLKSEIASNRVEGDRTKLLARLEDHAEYEKFWQQELPAKAAGKSNLPRV